MWIITILRDFTVSCVPVFLMLSGYLMCKKELNKNYYKGIIKTYSIYVLSCIAYLIYRFIVSGETFTLADLIFGILDFSILEYCWYVEMYLGLFIMIPFLNLIYNNLNTHKKKLCLIFTFLLLSAAPEVLNIHNFTVDGWWLHPTTSIDYQQLIPEGWITLGPITYYFLGCYLREYPLKISKLKNTLLLGIVTILMGSYDYFRSHDYIHTPGPWQSNDSLFCVAVSVLLFNLLANIDFEKLPTQFKKLLYHMSSLCFGAYLVSCIFDELIYDKVSIAYDGAVFSSKLILFPLLVPLIYICSLLLSFLLNIIYKSVYYICENIYKKIICNSL